MKRYDYYNFDGKKVELVEDNKGDLVKYSEAIGIIEKAVQEERDVCIIECIKIANQYEEYYLNKPNNSDYGKMNGAEQCADAIRSRK